MKSRTTARSLSAAPAALATVPRLGRDRFGFFDFMGGSWIVHPSARRDDSRLLSHWHSYMITDPVRKQDLPMDRRRRLDRMSGESLEKRGLLANRVSTSFGSGPIALAG